jgi:acetyl-CoA C-acetyltransferase
MHTDSIVIVGAARTPQGNLLGELKELAAKDLGAIAITAALQRAKIKPTDVSEVIMGCVLSAGQGQAPARQAALASQIPVAVPCTTINKMCGSGMKAVMLGCQILTASNDRSIIIAGGMESMSNAPYLLPKARQGLRLGHNEILDHLMLDGLEDAYDKRRPMGYFAELCAEKYAFSRATQDQYAIESMHKATHAIQQQLFDEIVPITLKTRQDERTIINDEHPASVHIAKIKELPAIFKKDGTITAANACSISDGASALVLMKESEAKLRELKPLARILAYSEFASAPDEFITAPIYAIKQLLHKLQWAVADVDLFEINEAFAVVPLAVMEELNIPRDKINCHGGGCALGHPIGSTGSRIIVSLVSALKRYKLKYGIAALCIGGGEATAIAVENLLC